NISSDLDLAGDLTIISGNDTNIKGSNIAVGGALTADSTGDITIESAEDSTYNYYANYKRSSFGRRSKSISESTEITNVASNIEAAGGINVQSSGDINIIASKLKSSVGDINITAANALNVISASDSLESQTISSRSGLTTRTNSSTINNVITQIASDISAENGNLSLSSGDDTTIIASGISGSGNIDIAAGTYEDSSGNVTNNTDAQVNILSSKDIDYAFQQSTKTSIGFNNIEDIAKTFAVTAMAVNGGFVAPGVASNINQVSAVKIVREEKVSESLKETIVAANITSTDNGNINISSGADTSILASNLKTTNGGDINITVGQLTDGSGVIVTNDDAKVTIAGASNKETSYNKDENFNYSMSIDYDGISYANYQKDTNQDILLTNVSSNLDSANNININAKSDLSLKGSDLTTNNGDINLTSEFGKVAIASAQNYADNVTKSDSGELGFKVQKDLSIEVAEFELIDENKGSITNIASNLTATQGEININSSEDVSVLSSSLNSDNGVNIVAGNDFNLLNSHDQIWSDTSSKKGTSGLKFETTSSEISAKAGVTYTQDKNTNTSTEVAASSIIANSGSINSVANNNINVVASKLIASNDIDLTATNNLNIISDDQISNSTNSSLMVDAGIRLGIDHNFGSTIESLEKLGDINVGDTINGALGIVEGIVNGEGLDGILSGNEEGINGTMRTFEAYQAFNQDPSANVALSVNVEVDGSKSKSNSSNAVESLLLAGNDINLTTTNEDITIKGSNIDANNIALNSGNDLEIVASQNNSNSSSKSYNFEVDVDIIGTNGVGATNINGNIANNKNTSVTNNNSLITASNNLVINTDNDTNISGANLIASNDLVVTTGNNLNIESLQDNIKSDNSSFGFDFGVGANGNSANVNAEKGKASKQWINNQTDLIGENSVTITTGNNTNLVGAVIANTKADGADGGNLTINTASLTYQDIKDKDKARSSSLGVGYGNDPDTGAQQSGSFNFGYSSHDIAQITKSTIGNGTINIAANSDISGLNRDIAKSQEITKNQVVGNVSGTIKFTSGSSDKDKESNKDGENNKSDSKSSIKDKTVAFLKSQGDQAKEWLRADKAITGSVKEAAKSAGATDLEKSIERGENRIDAG
ncbi:hemagglutinin repeat-containing protein, partial [Rickettsiales bacterium]|nr:hemagglutinin repeat-containing protein [Rickettsiales bacterium]